MSISEHKAVVTCDRRGCPARTIVAADPDGPQGAYLDVDRALPSLWTTASVTVRGSPKAIGNLFQVQGHFCSPTCAANEINERIAEFNQDKAAEEKAARTPAREPATA